MVCDNTHGTVELGVPALAPVLDVDVRGTSAL